MTRIGSPAALTGPIPEVPGLPVLGNMLAFRSDQLGLNHRAARLGPIAKITLGPYRVYMLNCADLAHEVLVTQAAHFRKSTGLRFLRPLLGNGLLIAEGEPHRQHRKLLAPAFAPRRLADYGEIMVAETCAQIARWRGGVTRIDLAAEMMEMTLAIAGRTLFGVDVRRDANTVARGVELGMRSMSANLTSPVRLGYRWPLPRHLRMRRAVALLDRVVYRLIAEGRARGGDRGDVLSMLLLSRDDAGGQLGDRQIRDEVMTLLLAGHETTANALSWTWYELGRHPQALAALEAEVDRVLAGRLVTTADLPLLPWTAAVIDEVLRLHPPAYVLAREAECEVAIGDHRFAPDSIVVINVRELHRRADYYPDPLAFRPERMIGEIRRARPRHHYLPFGAGPRVCIGAHFALMETQLALATMVQRVRIRPLGGEVVAEPLVTLRPRGGMPAIAAPR